LAVLQSETLVQKSVVDELESRKSKLKERLAALRAESEEVWKSMETAERSLNDIVAANDFDTTRWVSVIATGVDLMITIVCDFCLFSAKKMGFLKNMLCIHFFTKIAVF
jgi:hypothetical protein